MPPILRPATFVPRVHALYLGTHARARPHPGGGATHHPLRSTISEKNAPVSANFRPILRTRGQTKGAARPPLFVSLPCYSRGARSRPPPRPRPPRPPRRRTGSS